MSCGTQEANFCANNSPGLVRVDLSIIFYFENKDTVVSTSKQMQPGLSVLDGVSFSWTLPIEALISKSTFSSAGFLVSLPLCPANLLDKCKASLVWPQLGLPGYPQRLLSLGLSLQFRSPRLTLGFGSRYQLIFLLLGCPKTLGQTN